MSSRRVLKSAEAIREVVSTAILLELKDPRVRDVTVTFVEVSPDMRNAKVHVSIMGDEKKQRLSIKGLENAAGFLQYKIAQRIDTRYTPRIQFVLDQGVKHSIEVARILKEVLPKDPKEATMAEHDDSTEDFIDGVENDEAINASAEDNLEPRSNSNPRSAAPPPSA